MQEIFITVISLVVFTTCGFMGYCRGSSTMRKKGKLILLKTLIEARNVNGGEGRQRRKMDGWLTSKIRPLHRHERTGEL